MTPSETLRDFVRVFSLRFIGGFLVATAILVAASATSYFSKRDAYYQYLADSGMTWAGSWTWGFPFPMVFAGLGPDNHSMVSPLGFGVNVVSWLVTGGLVGMVCDRLFERSVESNL